MGNRADRISSRLKSRLKSRERLHSLMAHECGSHDGGGHHNQKCRDQTDCTADLDEQGDFDNRNRHKYQKQPHLRSNPPRDSPCSNGLRLFECLHKSNRDETP